MRETQPELSQRLVAMVRESVRLMDALSAVRELKLDAWCIGAGAVRTLVWDTLHAFEEPSPLEDMDVVYFDASAVNIKNDRALERTLALCLPEIRWEVTNQALVHQWLATHLGQVVKPLQSLEEGVATWPEYATCVGVMLNPDDSISVVAPHGLDDLFNLQVRHNPLRASVETYRQRMSVKRFKERWPKVCVLPA
ncbi:nucleotidyltransferase family protein [Polaromonas sp. UC242_47]|uniref:nucleotidyltransferase family protein n=1 Tax=Polaromonas sp. UC242_47 TaxID=3374626 RepID=UPI0037AAA86B